MQNPPEGITAKLVGNMSDYDLLDMHEFLTDDDLDDDEFEKGFYIDLFYHRLFALPVFGELSYYTKKMTSSSPQCCGELHHFLHLIFF
ncbi:hypothetical protein [Robinsoniella peoriensis]|uniref:hypothetical protein n=1 Tax=Robinsoniella peoriensis TaxID=180332 RepID=UPI0009F66051|nr:hypothetical protein [Robinsoniella peoriensis]